MTDAIGPGSLKLVAGSSSSRALRSVLLETLRAHIAENDVRHLDGDTFLAHTDAEPSTIRDWFVGALGEDESLFVVEFERWSAYGPAADLRWLLRRGH